MKQQQLIYENVAGAILELLNKAQHLEYRATWFEIAAGEPMNPSTNNRYNGFNRAWLHFACSQRGFKVNRWLTLKQANELGGRIKKGAKSELIGVYKRSYIDKDGKHVSEERYERMSEQQRESLKYRPMLRSYHVFNVAEVDGLPTAFYEPVNVPEVSEFEKNEHAEMLLQQSGAVIEHRGNEAFYNATRDFIVMPPHNQFKGVEPYYETVFHELAHWTGHSSRLNRTQGKTKSDAYAIEELVAELATAFVCASLGFESCITNNAAYLQNWIAALNEQPSIILKVMNDAQRAADYILRPIHAGMVQAA